MLPLSEFGKEEGKNKRERERKKNQLAFFNLFLTFFSFFKIKTSQESMAQGWYSAVEKLQGQQGTFWAGSVMSFEDVERTSVYANYLALRKF